MKPGGQSRMAAQVQAQHFDGRWLLMLLRFSLHSCRCALPSSFLNSPAFHVPWCFFKSRV
jgi:hypothetical protein